MWGPTALWPFDYDYDYDCIQGWGWEACTPVQLHTINNTQTKLCILIIITLNTSTMKYKSEEIKIIVYSWFKTI